MIEPNIIEEGFAELSSEVSTHDILSSKTIEPLNNTVFDKLVIETRQSLNRETYSALYKQHKNEMGYPPIIGGKYGERITFKMPDNPFTLVIYDDRTKIDLNPNRHCNYMGCHRFFGNLINDYDPEQTTIKRIDLNVDLGLKYDVVVESIVAANIRKCVIESYSGTRTKLKLGEEKSQFSIYNKSYFERLPTAWSRVEKRFVSNKCPIKNLSQIQELLELRPFEQISFYRLSAFEPETLSELIKWYGILYLKIRYGMQNTKRLLSKNGQFHRWDKYLEEVKPFCLDDFYKVNMEKYLSNNTIFKGKDVQYAD